VKNLIAASSIAITLGLEWKDLIEQVKTFTPPDGRCKVFIKNDVTIIDDTYNANLSSSLAALDYLKTFSSKGRKIFVFGDMFELGDLTSKQHQIVGEKCTEVGIDIVFTIGNHSRETHNALNPKIYKLHFKKQLNLITALKLNIKSNDIILIKGSRGMFMENVLKEIF
jgi:UDP-N-acetylmuramoyl-tripeptide--D-alanyl-D-alanine ligase